MKTLNCVFEEERENKFLFVEPGGNWGDYLIYYGAQILAKRNKLTFKSLSINEFMLREPDDSFVYIHGSGGFNEWCSSAAFKCLSHALKTYKGTVVQGPCTTSVNINFLTEKFTECISNRIAARFMIFARENTTFSMLEQIECLSSQCEIYLDHDTAFHLTQKDIIDRIGGFRDNYCLYGYRIDNESSRVKHKADIFKAVMDPPDYSKSFDHWLKLHAYASEIITNRTHSSIIGAILEKKTTLFASKYHKNRSIWEYSMQTKGVTWAPNEVAEKLAKRSFLSELLPYKVSTSFKARKFANFIRKVPPV